jgi:S-adenosylmethionine-diacylglycerol 3-amino-3-carboxypropyl transferase
MNFLYNYGISQEDALTESSALMLEDGDSLLCIASAGEIPLNIASFKKIRIVAVDISQEQLMLCRIKQIAALNAESTDAASFLGYKDMQKSSRGKLFRDMVIPLLPREDIKFWESHFDAIENGVINSGRFEQFMRKVSAIGRTIVGKKNLYSLFECDSINEQKEVFDSRINGIIVKAIFKTAFHPWIYKNRGIDPAGLTHSGSRNIAEFFLNRFRSFCCNTLARKNYYLQYTFFNQVLFNEALPEFLQPGFHDSFCSNVSEIDFRHVSLEGALSGSDQGEFNKIHISNIGDWISKDSMGEIFRLISAKTNPGARIIMRYIHHGHKIPEDVPELVPDEKCGNELSAKDRYPFYSIVPIMRN